MLLPEKVTLYPIYSVAQDDDQFDPGALPFTVAPEITVEDASGLFNDETFRWTEREMGRHDLVDLRSVRYAIVHRYRTEQPNRGGDDIASEDLVRSVMACLRLIRPMRQQASLMQGTMTQGRGFDVQHFEHPINLMNVPEVQKLFRL